jgi:hypothetical protein
MTQNPTEELNTLFFGGIIHDLGNVPLDKAKLSERLDEAPSRPFEKLIFNNVYS